MQFADKYISLNFVSEPMLEAEDDCTQLTPGSVL
jgi:hypothetical protein